MDPTLKLTIVCAQVMVILFSRRSVWRPSFTDIYSGLIPTAGKGYDSVSTSSLYDPTRLKTDSGVLFFFVVVVLLGAGLIDGQASSTCMFSRAAVGALIFASFAVHSMYYSNLARLR